MRTNLQRQCTHALRRSFCLHISSPKHTLLMRPRQHIFQLTIQTYWLVQHSERRTCGKIRQDESPLVCLYPFFCRGLMIDVGLHMMSRRDRLLQAVALRLLIPLGGICVPPRDCAACTCPACRSRCRRTPSPRPCGKTWNMSTFRYLE